MKFAKNVIIIKIFLINYYDLILFSLFFDSNFHDEIKTFNGKAKYFEKILFVIFTS